MKRLFVTLVVMMGIGLVALSQSSSHQYVTVVAEPDHADWTYKVGEKANIEIQFYKYGIPYNRPRFSARFWHKPTCPIHTLSTGAYNASWHLANVYAVSHMPLSRAI